MTMKGPQGGMLKLVSDHQVGMIYENALRVMEEVGISVKSEGLLEVFDRAGCKVSIKDQRVTIARRIVKEALEMAPKSIVMSGRDSERDVLLEDGLVYFVFGGTPNAHFIDLDTGNFRRPTLNDMKAVTTVADYFDTISVVMTTAGGFDAPEETQHLHELATLLEYTSKPIIYPAPGAEMARKALRIAAAVAGGDEEMTKRPILSLYAEPTSPLSFSEANDNIIEFAKVNAPIVCGPSPISGATAPMTMAGNATVGLAENLASLVLAQSVRPGAPFIYGPHVGVMDMKTARFCYGAPELHMGWVLQAQIAHYLGLPSFGQGGCNDAKCPDAQAGAEAAMSALLVALGGINLIHNVATTAMGDAGCLEMIVICDEILGYVLRILREIEIKEETLAFDVIKKVGPGGNFLAEGHTFNFFKKELYETKLFDRTAHETWINRGRRDVREIARERVKEILKRHRPKPLNEKAKSKIADIL